MPGLARYRQMPTADDAAGLVDDGAVALLTSDEYCQAKIYVEGSIEQIAIVAVADGPDAVKFVYLPMVGR